VSTFGAGGADVLRHARCMLDRDDRRLAVIAPDGPVVRTLGLAGIDRVITVVADRPCAPWLS
jgi:hypothetical protein